MAKVQIVLALDGNHKVVIAGDTPEDAQGALEWAQRTYEQLRHRYGPDPAGVPSGGLRGPAPEQPQPARLGNEESAPLEAPICETHQTPMAWVNKNGGFWSCHQRLGDGITWCNYRPARTKAPQLAHFPTAEPLA